MSLSGRRIAARLAAPLLALLAVLGVAAAWRFLEVYAPLTMERPVGQALTALACAIVIWLGLRLLDVVVWEGLRGPGPKRAPALVIVLVDGIVWLVAAAIIAQLVFELPVTAVAATSG